MINNIAIKCAMKVPQPWLWDTNSCLLHCGALHCNADLATHQRNFLYPEDVSNRLLCDVEYIKGKAVPLQAWSGPEGSMKLSFSDFMTTAPDGGKVVSLTHRPPLPPGNTPGTHFC